MVFIAKKWRYPRVVMIFFITELIVNIPLLVLFALADPDEYRTRLWEDGYKNGFNSNPKQALYDMANYRPVNIPLVWSQFITNYNVVISVLSTFLLLTKAIMFIMHLWLPILSVVIHGACVVLYAYSTYVQVSPDMSDPKQPQPGAPWYITKSCSVAHSTSNIGYCNQAKAAFSVTVVCMALYAANTFWAIWSCFPSKEEREHRDAKSAERRQDEEEEAYAKNAPSDDGSFEMNQMSYEKGPLSPRAPPMSPYTPRTVAFNQLGGGTSTASGGAGGAGRGAAMGGSLPLRNYSRP